MQTVIPDSGELAALLGQPLYDVWRRLCAAIEARYQMDRAWNAGGRAWKYEYKYRRGGRTLCALYAREGCMGFLVILGKDERAKFEAERERFSREVQEVYDAARTYHDGKWVLFEPKDCARFDDFLRLLGIKRRPNRA